MLISKKNSYFSRDIKAKAIVIIQTDVAFLQLKKC